MRAISDSESKVTSFDELSYLMKINIFLLFFYYCIKEAFSFQERGAVTKLLKNRFLGMKESLLIRRPLLSNQFFSLEQKQTHTTLVSLVGLDDEDCRKISFFFIFCIQYMLSLLLQR